MDTLQQALAEADAEAEAAMDAEPTPEPGSADGSDRETSPEPDPEALEHDEEMMGEGDRQDANDVDYDESILDDELRGVLQLGHDSNINTLNARAMAALTVRLYPEDQGPYFVANYDSSHVAAQFMDVIFCGLIYDFWPSFARFYRLPYPDMLMRFKDGSRHDAMGNWPIVELDTNTGLPRELTDAEIIEHTRQPEMKEWRHRRYKMHKMLSVAVRGCIALDYRREHFNIKEHPRRTVRADMHVTFNRILKCVFGVKAYSYFRGNMPHVPGYMHIDPGAMLASQPVKETLTETLILVRGHGYALPPDCDRKFTGYLRDKKNGRDEDPSHRVSAKGAHGSTKGRCDPAGEPRYRRATRAIICNAVFCTSLTSPWTLSGSTPEGVKQGRTWAMGPCKQDALECGRPCEV